MRTARLEARLKKLEAAAPKCTEAIWWPGEPEPKADRVYVLVEAKGDRYEDG